MRTHILFATVLTFIFSACSENIFDDYRLDKGSDINQITITAEDFITEDTLQTRTAFNLSNLSNITFQWSAKDTIGIFPSTGDQVSFPMEDGVGTNSAHFDGGGWELRPSSTYYAYYPFNRKNFMSPNMLDKIPYSYTAQKAAYENENKIVQVGAYDYMYAQASTPINGGVNFTFKHLGALCRMVVTFPETATYTNLTITANENIFPVKGTFNLTASSVVLNPIETSPFVNINLENLSANSGENKIIYFMLPPVDCTKLTSFEVGITTNNSNKYVTQIEKKAMLPGKAYGWNITKLSIEEGNLKNGVARLAAAGTLETILGSQKQTLQSLKIIGEINGTDVKCLRQMFNAPVVYDVENDFTGVLTELDLSEATIVEGGNVYYNTKQGNYPCVTKNNQIGESMFRFSKLTKIVLPNNIIKIADLAFYESHYIEEIKIPDSVTEICQYALCYCNGLRSVIIGNGVKSIGYQSFASNKVLADIIIPNSVEKIDERAFSSCPELLSVTIGDGVKEIEANTFSDCKKLASVNFGNGVTRIKSKAFYSCGNLKDLTLGNSLDTIEENAFNFGNLYNTNIHIKDISDWCEISGLNCFTSPKLYLNGEPISNIKNLVIPDGVTIIESYAFKNLPLTSVTIPNSVTKIGDEAFYHCSYMTNITIGNNVTAIGNNVFNSCSQLASVTIPNSVTTLGYNTFSDCKALTSVIIGNGITTIDWRTFGNCSNLTNIIIGENVTTIGENAFEDCSKLGNVTIPKNVTTIGDYAFHDCI